jgi:hypothetical protein
MITTDTIKTDNKSRAHLQDKTLMITIAGSEVQRTAFVVVDGEEVRIDALGPVQFSRFVARHVPHKMMFGTIIEGRIWHAEVV